MKDVVRRKADWSDVRVFWAVAELGSFGAAARALQIGLTTVTRAVDRLETRLNAKLLTRGPQGVALTETGSLAYDRALSMERVAEQLEVEIADRENAPEGRVKLMAPDGVAGVFLAPLMAEFIRANPKIDLVVDCDLWPDRPLGGEADLTLTFQEPKHPDAIATPLAHFHYALFASREYFDLYGVPATAAEIIAHPFIAHVGQSHHRENWTARSVAFETLRHNRIETNSSAVVVNAVKQGAGIAGLPTAILSLDPSLVMIETPNPHSIRLWLAHHRDISRSVRVRRVIDWLKDAFDPKTKPWYRAEFVHPREFGPYLQPKVAPALEPKVAAAAGDAPAAVPRRRARRQG